MHRGHPGVMRVGVLPLGSRCSLGPRLAQHRGLSPSPRRCLMATTIPSTALVPLAPRTARAIDLAIGERTEGPIFLALDDRRLDRHGAGRIARRTARRAGITKPVGPHTLRHAFITAALDAAVPLGDVHEASPPPAPLTPIPHHRARTSLARHP